ncbi:MAG: DUF488 domain-containing protein [Phycisphaerae bacterium]|nr:DUF488 domain-containing protein [Phycisphaerae bacterium]
MTTQTPESADRRSSEIVICTIGFAKKNARQFFGLLSEAGVRRVVDIRLNNVSQLAGFTKRPDLEFFLAEIGGVDYVHCPELTPPKELLDGYRKKEIAWEDFERRFNDVLAERRVESAVAPERMHMGCLLCSEPEPVRCHRRLVAEYLQRHWDGVRIQHL